MGRKTHFSRGKSRGVQYGLRKATESFLEAPSSDLNPTHSRENKGGYYSRVHTGSFGGFLSIFLSIFSRLSFDFVRTD